MSSDCCVSHGKCGNVLNVCTVYLSEVGKKIYGTNVTAVLFFKQYVISIIFQDSKLKVLTITKSQLCIYWNFRLELESTISKELPLHHALEKNTKIIHVWQKLACLPLLQDCCRLEYNAITPSIVCFGVLSKSPRRSIFNTSFALFTNSSDIKYEVKRLEILAVFDADVV